MKRRRKRAPMPLRPLSARFWEKVARGADDECWEWIAHRNACGYGTIKESGGKGPMLLAHRVSYSLANGIAIGEFAELRVCHRCDNPGCVNPSHLFLGTQRDNVRDMFAKGRDNRARGERSGRTTLTSEQVLDIRGGGEPRELAERFGVSRSTIHNIRRRRTWHHL